GEPAQVAGAAATVVKGRRDERGITHRATAEEFASFTMRMTGGAVATILLTSVAHYGPGHFAQVTGSDGTFVLTGESKLEMMKPDGPLEDVSAPDDLWERLTPNTMWARSFVRLVRDLVRGGARAAPTVPPATFGAGWRLPR